MLSFAVVSRATLSTLFKPSSNGSKKLAIFVTTISCSTSLATAMSPAAIDRVIFHAHVTIDLPLGIESDSSIEHRLWRWTTSFVRMMFSFMRSLADPIPMPWPSDPRQDRRALHQQRPGSACSTVIILPPTPRIKFSISCHAGLPFRLLIRQMETSAHSPDFHSYRTEHISHLNSMPLVFSEPLLDAVALAAMESVHILTLAFTPDPTATIALPVLQLSP